MNEEINKAYNSLPEEEKEKLNKFEKKGITEIRQKLDQQTGEILSTETTYNSDTKRKKGTFCISCPEELIKLASFSKIRAINKMLIYIINTINYKNEFTFDKSFKASYGEGKAEHRFFTDRKFLIDNQYIFKKNDKKNVYTLNVELLNRTNAYTTHQLYEEQFGKEMDEDSKIAYSKMSKGVYKLNDEDLKNINKLINKIMIERNIK